MSRTDLRLGIDLGTSAVKAVAIDVAGQVVASGDGPYPTCRDVAGQAEQLPSDWLSATAKAVADVARQLGNDWPNAISAIGLAGQLPTLVCLDKDGIPLGPAIAWCDSRADHWAADYLSNERRRELYRLTGMPIDGRYLAPMLHFHWQARRHEVRRILSAKDYLCFALTGRGVTDASTAAGYGLYDLAKQHWSPELCDFWHVTPDLLPDIADANQSAGGLDVAGARLLGLPTGIPVSVGAADSVAAALAISGLTAGAASIIMGSSTIVIAATDRLLLDDRARYLVTPHVSAGWYGREMDLLSSGTGFRWIAQLFGWSDKQFEAEALRSPPGAKGLTFAPYLAGGEQGALWNPNLSGVLHGLNLQQTGGDIARAFLEGVFFEIRRCLDVLAEQAPVNRLVLSGHATDNPGLMAMLADIVGQPVQAYPHHSPSAIGAALLAPGSQALADLAINAIAAPSLAPGIDAAFYTRQYQRYLDLFPRIADMPGIAAIDQSIQNSR
jgi:sugar (pentulose or hexulose) kinase